jgi:hypothetical protein
VAKGEALWTDEDRSFAMAWAEYQADMHICGHPASESMAQRVDDAGHVVGLHDYEVDSTFCYACRAVLQQQEEDNVSEDPFAKAYVYRVKRLD